MRRLILLIFTLITFVNAQTHKPQNLSIGNEFYYYSNNNGWVSYRVHLISGDTTILNTEWSIVDIIDTPGNRYYLRCDSTKLYRRDSDGTVTLRVDFDWQVGDTAFDDWTVRYNRIQPQFGDSLQTVNYGYSGYPPGQVSYSMTFSRIFGFTGYFSNHFGSTTSNGLAGAVIEGVSYGTVSLDNRESNLDPSLALDVYSYPNPFNSTINFRAFFPTSGIFNISVINLKGQLVKEICHNSFSRGYHYFEWSADGQSSGIYLVEIEGDGMFKTRKISLIK